MAFTDSPDQLLDACKTYHRTVALAQLDTPPGETRDGRLAEAMMQTESACTISALQAFANLGANAPAAQRPAMRRLNAWGLGMHVQQRLRPAWHAAQSRLQGATCYVDEEAIPLRHAFAHMAAERRRDQRAAIESAVVAQLGTVNEPFEACFEAHRRVAADLDFDSPDDLWRRIADIDAVAQQDAAIEVLEETREVYADLLAWGVKQRLRLPLSQLRRHDVLALFTFAEYQQYYQPGALVPAMLACCRHLGLDPTADGRLTWRERPSHFGPPEALALHVPDEVFLAYPPISGLKGAELWAGALGRALLWAHADPDLPLVHRLLADPAIAESSACLLAELAAHPDWLQPYLSVHVDENYRLWRRLDRLYRLRRQLGRFLFTRHLYTADSLAGAADTYRDLMMEACCVDYAPEYYLLDVDWHYESIAALWSQSLACVLMETLHQQFAADWFRNPDSGAWLRHFWFGALGGSVSDLLQRHLDASEWTAALFAEMLSEERL
jgi:hypothetical protein